MKVIRGIRQMSAVSGKLMRRNRSIGFVPTMGALHEGHLSLIRQARKECDIAVTSIFINPAQFTPEEDFRRYPRPVKHDIVLCRKAGVDFVFYPDSQEMYPDGFSTFIRVEKLSDLLCGKSRPGHFRGVATVVAKLFNIVHPDVAYFGQKDAQQAAVIKRLCCDLNFPIRIKVMPTVRERDGLAASSRNSYLNKQERRDALVLFKSLKLGQLLIKHGLSDPAAIIRRMRELINKKKSARVDYIAIVDRENLQPLKKITGDCLITLAVRVGKTRLIDNIQVRIKD